MTLDATSTGVIVGVGVTGVIKKGASAEEESSSPDNATSGARRHPEVCGQSEFLGGSVDVGFHQRYRHRRQCAGQSDHRQNARLRQYARHPHGKRAGPVGDEPDQTEVMGSGAIAIAVAGEEDSGVTDIAGAFALNQIKDDTETFVKGATLTVTDTASVLPTLVVDGIA